MVDNSHENHMICPSFASLKMVSKSRDYNHVTCLPVPNQRLNGKSWAIHAIFMWFAHWFGVHLGGGGSEWWATITIFLVYFWKNDQNPYNTQHNLQWKMGSKWWAYFALHFLIQNKQIFGNLYCFGLISVRKMVSNAHHFLPPTPSGCLIINVQTMWFSCNLLTNFILW